MNVKGTVYLVGAGPGDPRLLTLRGAELLRQADVVVYDTLVSPELLRLAPPEAERIPRRRQSTQAEVNDLLVERARSGKCVVRLKGGDPYVFGRGGEEAEGLAAARIPFQVVPGVSSVMAVPSYAGIPLTHRALNSGFTVVTGHEECGQQGSAVDWEQLAKGEATKVILMGAERLPELTRELRARGLPASTPAAVVRWGTTPRQHAVIGTLEDIAQRAAEAQVGPPAVVVLGDVVNLRARLNWYERLPLFGQRVVVTRARDQAAEFTRLLEARGADVLEIPCIRIAPPSRHEPMIDAIAGLGCYDWIIFTSANGVRCFFEYFFKAFDDLRDLGALRIAAVGPGTAARLEALHLKVDLVPKNYEASQIARALADFQSVENVRILLPRAEAAPPELPKRLEDLGAIVDDIPCYRTVAEGEGDDAGARLRAEGADWITFTSGSTVEQFHARFDLPALLKRFPGMRLVSIGPETTASVRALTAQPVLQAKPHTLDGITAALEKACQPRQPAVAGTVPPGKEAGKRNRPD